MTKLLYITARPHDEQASYSLAVGKVFKEAYIKAHPEDEVIHLDLYEADVPYIDNDVFSGWGKLASGTEFDQLTAEEKRKVGKLGALVEQFVEADKYVFVTPLWNLSFPPVLKAYIDAVSVVGKTFKYTEQGPVGLLGGRKVLHIQARGGIYSYGPSAEIEMGDRYLKAITKFYGVEDYQGIYIEGIALAPEKADAIKAEGIKQAQELAQTF
ncbi:MAG: FMN-dependent NADH-azoreductase [Gorillibacterium sp.]|nr:FMN-dependent NADH-azoreductase [Gorillibacterium sp.]